MRTDGRKLDQLRDIHIEIDYIKHAEGSTLIRLGDTHVITTVTVDESIPKWLQGEGKGWLTAEYNMLPRSTHSRIKRDKALSGGRAQEISRLIGRSLRAALDLKKLGEKMIYVDCDVIQADGGTRTASIIGGYVALVSALKFLHQQGKFAEWPIKNQISAISVGLKEGAALLDLNYDEDSNIETDMNFVINDKLEFIEVQGTAENESFTRDQLLMMMDLAQKGCQSIFAIQNQSLEVKK